MSETLGRWFDLAATTLVSMNTVVVLSEVYFELNIKWTECEHVEPRTTERELSERTVVLHYQVYLNSISHFGIPRS